MGRILIVEDDNATRAALERLLRLDGHEVIGTASVADAMRAIQQSDAFDILVSDLILGDGTGWDLLTRIERDKSPGAAIAISGSVSENEMHRSLTSGFCRHLTKPVSFTTVLETIENCLRERATGG